MSVPTPAQAPVVSPKPEPAWTPADIGAEEPDQETVAARQPQPEPVQEPDPAWTPADIAEPADEPEEVEQPTDPVPEPDPEPEPAPPPPQPVERFDWAAAEVRRKAMDAIKNLAALPAPSVVIDAWKKHTGYGEPVEMLDKAAAWLAEFIPLYREVEPVRWARIERAIAATVETKHAA